MSHRYHEAQRSWQDAFDSRRLADRLAEATTATIGPEHRRFIEARDMFFLATADQEGRPQCSYKGGDPGFVRVIDDHTMVFPLYDGNGMFLSCGNMSVNPNVGLLFIDFEGGTRLRVNGEAAIDPQDPIADTYADARLLVRVHVREVFANCRRYVHRSRPIERSPFVPTAQQPAPVPDWKLDPWFEGTLPADDPAQDSENPAGPSIPQF